MTPATDQLVAEVAFLKERVNVLEKISYATAGEYVEGWTSAARMLGVNERTCKRRHEASAFPEPCGWVKVERGQGVDHERPRWRRRDLVAYAEDAADTNGRPRVK